MTTLGHSIRRAEGAPRQARLDRGGLQFLRRADHGRGPGTRRGGGCGGRTAVAADDDDHRGRVRQLVPDEDQASARTSAPSPAGPRLSRRAFLRRGGRRRGGHRPRGSRWLRPRGRHRRVALLRRREPTPFHGPHQAGIVTPAQDRMYTAAFDLTTTSRDELLAMLRRWTIMSARLTRGLPAGPIGLDIRPYDAPPEDTGEAMDLPRGGPHHHPRVRPVAVRRHARRAGGPVRPGGSSSGRAHRAPAFPGRRHRSCAFGRRHRRPGLRRRPAGRDPCHPEPDPAAFGTARVRWSQLGFGRTSSTSQAQLTPRNLFGFKDGTANIMAEETARARAARLGASRRRRRPPAGWRVARTWSPGASG